MIVCKISLAIKKPLSRRGFRRLCSAGCLLAKKAGLWRLGESLSAAGEKINLFSKKAPIQQLNLLLEQSLISCRLLAPVFKGLPGPALDLGSGNGMPGLVCAALYPQTAFILCEKSRKKAEFLKLAVFLSKIQNASVLCQRAGGSEGALSRFAVSGGRPLKRLSPAFREASGAGRRGFFVAGFKLGKILARRLPVFRGGF